MVILVDSSGKCRRQLFTELVQLIDTDGYKENFYSTKMIFFDYNEHTYWHMENIINRCLLADTYHKIVVDGRLPKTSS